MEKVLIYSLNCPFTNVARYVGKTKNTLPDRLSQHLSNPSGNIEKAMWINSLKQKAVKPTINLLEVVNLENWEEKEIWWIQHFLDKGAELLNQKLDENHKTIILKKYREVLNRVGYSYNTKKNYTALFLKFLKDFDGFVYKDITKEQITAYLTSLVEINHISEPHQNSIINAIKFYYEKVLGFPREVYYIKRPFKRKKIRPILRMEQIFQLIESYNNLKQKTAIQIMYSGALRISEVCNLLTCDFKPIEKLYIIRDPKGGDDRPIPLPEHTVTMLLMYIDEYKPKKYLFAGQKEGYPYSPKSIQERFSEQVAKLGFDPELTPHCIRHSRISHVLNAGAKIEMVSKQAGHSSISTTADTYHHYMIDEMQSQFEAADKKILEQMQQRLENKQKQIAT